MCRVAVRPFLFRYLRDGAAAGSGPAAVLDMSKVAIHLQWTRLRGVVQTTLP